MSNITTRGTIPIYRYSISKGIWKVMVDFVGNNHASYYQYFKYRKVNEISIKRKERTSGFELTFNDAKNKLLEVMNKELAYINNRRKHMIYKIDLTIQLTENPAN